MPPVASSSWTPVHLLPSGRRLFSRKCSNLCATCNPPPDVGRVRTIHDTKLRGVLHI
jgi:hypothetical protein